MNETAEIKNDPAGNGTTRQDPQIARGSCKDDYTIPELFGQLCTLLTNLNLNRAELRYRLTYSPQCIHVSRYRLVNGEIEDWVAVVDYTYWDSPETLRDGLTKAVNTLAKEIAREVLA